MAKQLYIVVIGCGRLGADLANRFSRSGDSVVVIDSDPQAFGALSQSYGGFRVEGDATELAVLKQAKANKADLLVAATGTDNVNLMVAQVTKSEWEIPKVLARVHDPGRGAVFQELGVDTICPTLAAVDLFLASAEALHR
jgi:trk system potassium uptake protein TrkA